MYFEVVCGGNYDDKEELRFGRTEVWSCFATQKIILVCKRFTPCAVSGNNTRTCFRCKGFVKVTWEGNAVVMSLVSGNFKYWRETVSFSCITNLGTSEIAAQMKHLPRQTADTDVTCSLAVCKHVSVHIAHGGTLRCTEGTCEVLCERNNQWPPYPGCTWQVLIQEKCQLLHSHWGVNMSETPDEL